MTHTTRRRFLAATLTTGAASLAMGGYLVASGALTGQEQCQDRREEGLGQGEAARLLASLDLLGSRGH